MLVGTLIRRIIFTPRNYKIYKNFSKIPGMETMVVDKDAVIPPISEMNFTDGTIQNLAERGISTLFPIQYHTFKDVTAGRDIIAKDKTGSGKTLAYALPVTERLRKLRQQDPSTAEFPRKPRALVMVPTRELAIQVYSEFEKLAQTQDDHISAAYYGGVSIMEQMKKARMTGMDILVATPGRLQDHISRGSIDLSLINTVILDETDEMLEIGFKDAILKILSSLKSKSDSKVQYLLFSATVPAWVAETAKEFMKNVKFYDMVKSEGIVIPKDIRHLLVKASHQSEILNSISSVVDSYAGIEGQTIIFTNTKREADEIVKGRYLRTSAKALHGDIQQDERESIFRSFKDGTLKCLVATNVAARGLDFPAVDLIIQINPPNDIESYVHRSGRTGRAGRKGINVLIYSEAAEQLVTNLKREAKVKFEIVNNFMLQELKTKSEDTFKQYVVAAMDNLTEDQLTDTDQLVDQIISKHGEKEALRRIVSYIIMNPLERRDLRQKSKFSTSGDSDSYSRPSYGDRGRSDFGDRGRSDFGDKGRSDFGERRRPDLGERTRPFSSRKEENIEFPTDMFKAVFVSGLAEPSQLDDLLGNLRSSGIQAVSSFSKFPEDGSAGFAFLTPSNISDLKKIIAMRTVEIGGSNVTMKLKRA